MGKRNNLTNLIKVSPKNYDDTKKMERVAESTTTKTKMATAANAMEEMKRKINT